MLILISHYCTWETEEICEELARLVGRLDEGITYKGKRRLLGIALEVCVLNSERVLLRETDNYARFNRRDSMLTCAYRIDYDAFLAASPRIQLEMFCDGAIVAAQMIDEEFLSAEQKQQLIVKIEARRDAVLETRFEDSGI